VILEADTGQLMAHNSQDDEEADAGEDAGTVLEEMEPRLVLQTSRTLSYPRSKGPGARRFDKFYVFSGKIGDSFQQSVHRLDPACHLAKVQSEEGKAICFPVMLTGGAWLLLDRHFAKETDYAGMKDSLMNMILPDEIRRANDIEESGMSVSKTRTKSQLTPRGARQDFRGFTQAC